MDDKKKMCYYMCVTKASTDSLLAPFWVVYSPTCICGALVNIFWTQNYKNYSVTA